MAGKFEISKRSNGEYQFNLKAGNGQVILTSEGYGDKNGCANGIESVRKHAQADANFERKTATVRFDAGKADVAALVKATTEAGFPSTPRK